MSKSKRIKKDGVLYGCTSETKAHCDPFVYIHGIVCSGNSKIYAPLEECIIFIITIFTCENHHEGYLAIVFHLLFC